MIMRKWVLVFVLALLAVPSPCDMSSQAGKDRPALFEIGKPFPTFSLPALDGRPLSIADFRGKKLILHIFASW
jgi:hypothetical protein